MFESLGKFQIKELLGQGAMGEVYLGMDPSIGRKVAIKTILPSVAQGEDAKARFEREAKAAGILNHPNLVTIYEFGEDQGVLYIAMEYVQGYDLEELLQKQSLTRTECLEILAQVCDGLAHAHRAGIVHRDIKPSNIRVMREGSHLQTKVMDFGVARISGADLTATGIVMGTVSYMAPEYIRTGKPDSRSDLFAVGVMLYEALSGRKPFSGDTTPTILYKIVNEAVEPIEAENLQGISASARMVLDRALCKDPDQRFQTADALAQALRAAKDPTWSGQLENSTARIQTSALPTGLASPEPARPTKQEPLATPERATPAPASKGAWLIAASIGFVLLAGGGYGAYTWMQQRQAKTLSPASTQTTVPSPVPAQANTPEPAQIQAHSPIQKPTESPASDVPKAVEASVLKPDPAKVAEPKADPSPKNPKQAPTPVEVFKPENLEKMEVFERKSLGNVTYSEAITLVDKDPERAIAGFRQALKADPTNPNVYAWLVVTLYDQKRYAEIPPVLAQAQRHGISRSEMARNLRFRMVMQKDAMNRHIPGDD